MSSSRFPVSRRALLTAGSAGATAAFGLLRFAPAASATVGPQNYTASWSSVDQHPPTPEWFQDAKFGIYPHWGVFPLGGGYYRIVNNTNGMVADSWGDTADGAPARQAAWDGGNNQQWTLNSAGNGRYHIVNRGTGTALDGAGSTAVGATTVMWSPNSSPNNEWSIVGV